MMGERVDATAGCGAASPWVLVADERTPTDSRLAPILDAIERLGFGARHAPSIEHAVELLRLEPTSAVVWAGPDGAGPIVARDLLRRVPDLSLVLHGQDPGGLRDVVAAYPAACATLESTVAPSLVSLIPALGEVRRATRELRSVLSRPSAAGEEAEALPPSFRIDTFQNELEGAMLVAAHRCHGSIARAATALGMAERLARRRMAALPARRVVADPVPAGPFVAWVSAREPPPGVVAAGEALGVRVRRVQPGYAARWNPADEAVVAAIADVDPVGAAMTLADGWVMEHSARGLPVVLCGMWSAPTLVLADRLGMQLRAADPTAIEAVLAQVLRLGRAAARVRAVTADSDREDRPATWSLDLPDLLGGLEDELLELSDRTHDGGAAAAAALGLARSTYYFRLQRARRRRRPGPCKTRHGDGPSA